MKQRRLRARVGVGLCWGAGLWLWPLAAAGQPSPSSATPAPVREAPAESPEPEGSPSPEAPSPEGEEPGVPAATEPAEVTLFLRNGQQVTGLLMESTAEHVVVRIAGIDARFETGLIERYEVLPPIIERYVKLRETIGDDAVQILRLAQWLQAREKYELALAEAQRARALDPESVEAKRLVTLLEQQIRLKVRGRPPAERGPAKPADPGRREEPLAPVDFPLLSADQINLMKVYELDLRANPRVLIPRATIERMLAQHAGNPLVPVTKEGRDALLRRDPLEILNLMFELRARDLYPQVQVLDQPRPMQLFRDHVQRTWLLNSCATTLCHGGTEAGRLVLYNRRPNSDASVYTNFLILDRFRLSDGTPLINWDAPEQSPLLHMGLPREDSRYPHPVVPRGVAKRDAWRWEFRNREDRQFTRGVEWMRAMVRPRAEHPIDYQPLRPLTPPPKPEAGEPERERGEPRGR